jgi:AraC-like DNA-binding protein
MIDFATSVKTYQRVIHQPPGARPRWINEEGRINELQYLSWGWREYGRHPIPPSLHEGWTYQYVAAGRPLLDTGEKRIPVPQGHLAVIGPSCPNGWQATRPADRCRILTWIWRDAPLLPAINPGEKCLRLFPLSPEDEKQIHALHEETRLEITRTDAPVALAIHAIRSRIDILLSRRQSQPKTDTHLAARMEYALNWLRQHPEELHPAAALADYLQVSPATLNRLFQKHLGQNVREAAYLIRMEAARQMLDHGKISVKEVAFRLGYSHANDFTRAYTRLWGTSPTGRLRRADGASGES